MKYVEITIRTETQQIVLEVKKWLLWTIFFGILIGIVVAVNVAFNPTISASSIRMDVWVGMTFWAFITGITWALSSVDSKSWGGYAKGSKNPVVRLERI